jgi:hypothetical protein
MSVGRMGARAAFAAVGVLVAMAFGAVSASAETVEFKPSAEQSFKVPAGVSQLEVVAVGGAGEAGGGCTGIGGAGGSGANATATLPVGAGEELKVRFGGGGAGGAGEKCNGGAGGSRSELLSSSPLVVAAGGGGGGGTCCFATGGAGGSAKALKGDDGLAGSGVPPESLGGGGEGGGASPGEGGAGGTREACGAGFPGVLETGGAGGGIGGHLNCEGGGGGGGGHKGGGGGGSGFFVGGGGGAGASFIASTATIGAVRSGAEERQRVTITYTVAPSTCGKTTVGKKTEAMLENLKRVNACALPFNATVSELVVYLSPTSRSGSQLVKGIVYADSNGKPAALLGTTTQLSYVGKTPAGWYKLPFATPLKLAAGNYWIGIITGASAKVAGESYDTLANAQRVNTNKYSSGPSNPFGSFKTNSEQMSLYATFTPQSTCLALSALCV